MDIIHKFIPKNPINGDIMNKINQKCSEVLKYFVTCYNIQTILVILGNKEKEYEYQQIRDAIIQKDKLRKEKYYKMKYGEDANVPEIPIIPSKYASLQEKIQYCHKILKMGFKPVFPRVKYEPIAYPKLELTLDRYIIRDQEYDPYAVYIILATRGKETVEKERRFREFEKLNKVLKKLLPKDTSLPPASSKIGGRNLNEYFLKNRVDHLNYYLQRLLLIPEIVENEAFQKFIGLYPTDPLDELIFDATYKQTKYHFWCWFDSKYDSPGDAMAKLVTRLIWDSVNGDIYAALPIAEAPRKASIKLAFKIIAGVVDKGVPPALDVAYNVSKCVRKNIFSTLDKAFGLIIKTKNDLNIKIKENMEKAFEPIREGIGEFFSMAVHDIVPIIVEPFIYIYKTYQIKSEPLIIESFKNCDYFKLNEVIDNLNKILKDLVEKLNSKVDGQLRSISGDLQGFVNLTYLKDCFNPMVSIGRIISDFVRIINPEHWSKVAIKIFDYKKKLTTNDGEDLDNILVDMERNALYVMDCESYFMNNERYWLRGDIYGLGLDLNLIAEVCFILGKKLIKQVYRKSCKKFIRKFSDYLWGFKNKTEDNRPWNEKVDEAFMTAYQAAKHKFNKECGNIVKEFICDILNSAIIKKVNEEINKVLEPVLKDLDNEIPEEIKNVIIIEDIAQKNIEFVLRSIFKRAIYEQEGTFLEELNKAIKNCEI